HHARIESTEQGVDKFSLVVARPGRIGQGTAKRAGGVEHVDDGKQLLRNREGVLASGLRHRLKCLEHRSPRCLTRSAHAYASALTLFSRSSRNALMTRC